MKKCSLFSFAVALTSLLAGCGSVSSGTGDSLNSQVAAKQREMQRLARIDGNEPTDSPRNSYPGGTTAAEWKSLSPSTSK
jgi:hypothetical protein